MDILNLPGWLVVGVDEQPGTYLIAAEYSTPPAFCPRCACLVDFDRFGTRAINVADLPIHGKKVTIQAERQRFRCKACRFTFTADNHLIDEKRRVTKRLVEYVQRGSFKRTFTRIANELGLDDDTVRSIFRDHVRQLERSIQFETPQWLGIDEVRLLGKPRCVMGNVQERTIVDMLSNRNKPTVAKRLLAFPNREQIELACMDMWNPYREAVQATLPNARIVADKFHVVRLANQAVESVRKQIRATLTDKERRALMHDRFVLLKRERDLNDQQRLILDLWKKNHPALAKAHELKGKFFDIWDSSPSRAEAEKAYEDWQKQLGDLASAFTDLTRAIGNWREEVFTYFDLPVTNAYTEAINGLIKLANRQGRGYSFEVIRAKMLFSPENHQRQTPTFRPGALQEHTGFTYDFTSRGVDIIVAGRVIETMISTADGRSEITPETPFSTR